MDNRCKIWPEFSAKVVLDDGVDPKAFTVVDSPRAGGIYAIDMESAEWCAVHNDEESRRVKARITTSLIDQRAESHHRPTVTRRLINRSLLSPDLSALVRAERLLYKLVNDANRAMNLSARSISVPGLLAWSESVEDRELKPLFDLLKSIGFMESEGMVGTVTERGHQRIQELNEPPKL